MSTSAGAILAPEEENDADVRREDQENINKFGRLNARLYELRAEREELKKKLEQTEDASTELMMGSGDKVSFMLGGAFFEVSEEEATEMCEDVAEKMQRTFDALEDEEDDILEQQKELKTLLYSRFGKSINLEDK